MSGPSTGPCSVCGQAAHGAAAAILCDDCEDGVAIYCKCGQRLQRGNFGTCDDCHGRQSGDPEVLERA